MNPDGQSLIPVYPRKWLAFLFVMTAPEERDAYALGATVRVDADPSPRCSAREGV
jgi:hypothetical protein